MHSLAWNSSLTSVSEQSVENVNGRKTARAMSEYQQRLVKLIECTRNGLLPNYIRASITKQHLQDHLPSRLMRIIPQRPVPHADIQRMRIARVKGYSLYVKSVITRYMQIWWEREISPCERFWFGTTGSGRGACQSSLMPRIRKPKLHACEGLQS